ncbi:MAG: TadE/TadG family protein [Gemmataceae bacterium]|nr:TadE/TadG family protein [Gemmataceae bacterium]
MRHPMIRLFHRGRSERGAVAVLVALAMIPLLGMVGLALDLGRGYVARSNLSRAVDAAVLGSARVLRQGRAAAEREAFAIAAANGMVEGENQLDLTFTVTTDAQGRSAVAMGGTLVLPTSFMRVLGFRELAVASAAEAVVPPIDLVLVIDRSGSLETQGAWGALQQAARRFIRFFDDELDQLGMVSFQVRANTEATLDLGFSGPLTSIISGMNSAGDTNTGEGLRLAFDQFQLPAVRESAAKVVVFFTDGRPTAFRDSLGGQDRVMAVHPSGTGRIRGYFNNPDQLPMDQLATPSGCAGAATCFGFDEASARDRAKQDGILWADRIRGEGVYVYAIGLGNPTASDPLLVPDMTYLELLANVSGVANPSQPRGQARLAPSAAELESVFQAVAEDLIVRLSR